MINNVTLIGRLTRDPDLRYTNSGTAVASFSVAVDRQFRNANGDRDADFINCVIWRKAAENFANFTHKGSLVGIDGRIQTRNYENQQGQRVYVTEVVVQDFCFLDPKNRDSHQENNQQPSRQGKLHSNGYNLKQNTNNSQKNKQDPYDDGSQSIDIDDSDLPF